LADVNRTFDKDPDAVLDYGFDWNPSDLPDDDLPYLVAGEIIISSSWEANDAGVVIDIDTFSDTVTTVWLSGGTVGETYTLTNHIETSAGREDDRSFDVIVKER